MIIPAPSPAEGRIITFYSYKGGTGRSMALANVAWILASNGKRVLVIDWDLEAPGLHRYFHPYLSDKNLSASDGLMEFVMDYATEALTPPPEGETLPDKWYVAHADITSVAQSIRFRQFRDGGRIDFVPAGRQADSYAELVSAFNWQNFYRKLGGHAFFEAAKAHMRAAYDYVLIDSRTGVSDTSGICTIQMPDTVVICFTLNIQSLEGAAAAAAAIEQQRRAEQREVRILPVPTRVDRSEKAKVEAARLEAWKKFDKFLWQFEPQQRSDYWSSIEIAYEPWYAFEEVLAPFGDRTRQQSSMLATMETLAAYVTEGAVTASEPLTDSERAHGLELYLGRGKDEVVVLPDASASGEQAIARLDSANQQHALDVLLRLVFLADGAPPVARADERRLLGDVPDRVMQALQYADLIEVTKQSDGTERVELARPDLLTGWSRLKRAMEADLPFLLWRQKLGDDAVAYERTEKSEYLLRGSRLEAARQSIAARPDAFNDVERRLVNRSTRRQRMIGAGAAAAAILLTMGAFGWSAWRNTDRYQVDQIFQAAPKIVSRETSDLQKQSLADEEWIRALVAAGKTNEARQVTVGLRAPARRAYAWAVLAAALSDPGQADKAKSLAAAAADEVTSSPADHVRALIRVAHVLGTRQEHRETATRLLQSAVDVARTITPAEPGQRAPINADALTTQFKLYGDIAVELAVLGQPSFAANALRDAMNVELDARTRTRMLLDVAKRIEQFKDTGELAYTLRRAAAQTLLDSEAATQSLPDIVPILSEGDRARNCELLVDVVSDARVDRNVRSYVLTKVFQSLTRSCGVALNDPLWSKAISAIRRDGLLMLLPDLAAAQAACGDDSAARRTLDATQAVAQAASAKTPDVALTASINASVSGIRCALDGRSSPESDDLRRSAVELANKMLPASDQDFVRFLAAVAAARCGETREAVTLRNGPGVVGSNEEVILALADATTAVPKRNDDETVRAIIHLASRMDDHDDRDRTLNDTVKIFVARVKPGPALELAGAIDSDDAKLEAYHQILAGLGRKLSDGDLKPLVDSIKNPYIHAKALLDIADRQLDHQARPEALVTVARAESIARGVGDGSEKSDMLRLIAVEYARAGDLRNGRRAADACADDSDKLRGYAAVVANWATRQQSTRPM